MRLVALLLGAGLALGAASTAAAAPQFTAEVAPVRWADLRFSYRAGCPVGPAELRTVRLSYWGFDGRARVGSLVVNQRVARDVVMVFRRLYRGRFPIRRMVPVSRYRGSDDASMAADNTSAFNCRFVDGTTRWSEHAYGRAIDVNPIENPYVSGGHTSHRASRAYVERSRRRPGMAYEGGALVRAFDRIGWGWGGRWTSVKDYQHFSASGS